MPWWHWKVSWVQPRALSDCASRFSKAWNTGPNIRMFFTLWRPGPLYAGTTLPNSPRGVRPSWPSH